MSNNPSSPLNARPLARFGCYLGLLIALAMLLHGLHMLATGSDNAMPFKVAILLGGAIQAVTCLYALRGNRPAWSFAVSLNGTLFVVFLFGAPKVRDGLDVSMALGLLPCAAFGVTTALLALGSNEY